MIYSNFFEYNNFYKYNKGVEIMYKKAYELTTLCKEKNKKIHEIAIEKEINLTGTTEKEIRNRFKEIIKIMEESSLKTLKKAIPSVSGLTGGTAKKLMEYIENKNITVLCKETLYSVARAFSCFEVNASMGKIVAAPTAGSCGILPACLLTIAKKIKSTEEKLINAVITATAIGDIIEQNATLSGAEGGCQAECGSAAAMASGALVYMLDGTVESCFHAASMTLTNVMGQVCDPIAGLVEIPCAKRNAIGVVNAFLCADMALAGIECVVPFDEVVEAMYNIGKSLPPELRETGLGGLAGTQTGAKIRKKIFGE